MPAIVEQAWHNRLRLLNLHLISMTLPVIRTAGSVHINRADTQKGKTWVMPFPLMTYLIQRQFQRLEQRDR